MQHGVSAPALTKYCNKEPQPSERGITNDLGKFTDIPEGKRSNQLIVTEPE